MPLSLTGAAPSAAYMGDHVDSESFNCVVLAPDTNRWTFKRDV